MDLKKEIPAAWKGRDCQVWTGPYSGFKERTWRKYDHSTPRRACINLGAPIEMRATKHEALYKKSSSRTMMQMLVGILQSPIQTELSSFLLNLSAPGLDYTMEYRSYDSINGGPVMATPVKKENVTCFCCLAAGQTTSFKLGGKKCEDKCLLNSLSSFLDSTIITELNLLQCLINNDQNGLVHALFNDRLIKERLGRAFAEEIDKGVHY
ncbi:unnamed protein product [Mytilus coruscus]|uniref:Uncharacterized protein n=1 Tax=Mytilus coruscus TaxID=42192 RepID=A0A6J8E9U0_MYTCO|nr:unnamed protein product [Mytilus coruscus]